jgi:hypothetical protein
MEMPIARDSIHATPELRQFSTLQLVLILTTTQALFA